MKNVLKEEEEALTWVVYEAMMVVGGMDVWAGIKDLRLKRQCELVRLCAGVATRLRRDVDVKPELLRRQRRERTNLWHWSEAGLERERQRRRRLVREGLSWPENMIYSIARMRGTARR